MAIKVSGTVVIDNDRNANCGVITATAMDITPAPITFSPTDGSTGNAIGSNIVITYIFIMLSLTSILELLCKSFLLHLL